MTKPEIKTDVAVIEEQRLKLEKGQPSFADMMALASTLLKTGFLPKAITTPGQALAIILTGQEMGLGPMQSLRSIGVINGRPVVAADLQLALFHRAGGQSKWVTLTDEEAALWLRHPNGVEHTESFTMADAQRAKLTGGASGIYEKFPKAMLRSRAITAGLKSLGFEPTAGVYDPDELAGLALPPSVPTAAELRQLPAALAEPEPAPPWEQEPPAAAKPAPGEAVWPWGKQKGKPLREFSTEDLKAAQIWIAKTGRGAELRAAIDALLLERGVTAGHENPKEPQGAK